MTSVPPSCMACPSYLPPAQTPSKFKKSIGSALCGRYGIVLDKPGLPVKGADKLAMYFASKCDSFGLPLPVIPIEKRLKVVMPDPMAMQPADSTDLRDMCNTCAQCKKYVSESAVLSELGWASGLCSAKGKLILTTSQVIEARNCEYREYGSVRHSAAMLPLLPEYEDAFGGTVDPVRAFFAKQAVRVEPQDYPTDKPVSAEDIGSGIKAWRRVTDPAASGREVFLPIYLMDFFSEDEQAKIPKAGDEEYPEMYVDHFGGVYLAAVTWTELDETPALWGQAGVGKTELFRHLAYLMSLPFERLSITGQTDLDDLAGKMRFSPEQGTYFQYGRLPLAWQKPCVICIDEPNVGPAEVWQFLRPLTDNSKQLVLDMNSGERISRHNDAYLGMAMNPAWDVKNIGAFQIGDADASRLFHVYIDLPPEVLEREIIRQRVERDGRTLTVKEMDTLMAIAKDLRGLCDEGTLPISWGIRPQIKVARAMHWFDLTTAYARAVGDYLEPEARTVLMDVIKAHAE